MPKLTDSFTGPSPWDLILPTSIIKAIIYIVTNIEEKKEKVKGILGGIFQELKPILKKIWYWIVLTWWMFLASWFVLIFQCSKPKEGYGTCINSEQKNSSNIYTFDVKDVYGGGKYPDTNMYSNEGQEGLWVDTGFETTGDPLVIYADGDYFPWGKNLTEKVAEYNIRQTPDGQDVLDVVEGYKACELNTKLLPVNTDNEDTRWLYANQLNSYTLANPENRIGIGRTMLSRSIQADCIKDVNCKLNSSSEYPQSCALKHGAGIYLRIGDDSVKYSYHIINHYVPKLVKHCENSTTKCNYTYNTIDGKVEMIQIPFSLPIRVYNTDYEPGLIKDIRDTTTKFTPITEYSRDTDYKFTTIELVSQQSCENLGYPTTQYETINGFCYKSVTKTMTPDELANPTCPIDSSKTFIHPNELCNPQSGKKIWVKTADTFYEDDEGTIKINFDSGAKKPTKTYENAGFQIGWIQKILYAIISPFWGDQSDSVPIKENTIRKIENNTLKIKSVDKDTKELNDDELFITNYNGDIMIKNEKYASAGLLIQASDQKTTNFLEANFTDLIVKNKVIVSQKADVLKAKSPKEIKLKWTDKTMKDYVSIVYDEDGNATITRIDKNSKETVDEPLYIREINGDIMIKMNKYGQTGLIFKGDQQKTANFLNADYESSQHNIVNIVKKDENDGSPELTELTYNYTNSIPAFLIKISNLNDGWFIKIRNKILSHWMFEVAKILFILWFVWSYGVATIRKYNTLSMKLFTHDWPMLLIILFFADKQNYQLIDEVIWPGLFYGAQSLSSILFNAGSLVFGTSMDTGTPYEYFNDVIETLTSKETFLKYMAIATSSYFYFFFIIFPIIFNSALRFGLAVLGPISTLVLTIFGVGQLIMFMPFYAFMSLTESNRALLINQLKGLLQEFLHFTLEIGFFGLFIGFIYYYFTQAMDFGVCWEGPKFKINFFSLIKLEWGDWNLQDMTLTGCVNILKKGFLFMIFSFLSKFLVDFAVTTADSICKSAGLGLGLKNTKQFTEAIGQIADAFGNGLKALANRFVNGSSNGKSSNGGSTFGPDEIYNNESTDVNNIYNNIVNRGGLGGINQSRIGGDLGKSSSIGRSGLGGDLSRVSGVNKSVIGGNINRLSGIGRSGTSVGINKSGMGVGINKSGSVGINKSGMGVGISKSGMGGNIGGLSDGNVDKPAETNFIDNIKSDLNKPLTKGIKIDKNIVKGFNLNKLIFKRDKFVKPNKYRDLLDKISKDMLNKKLNKNNKNDNNKNKQKGPEIIRNAGIQENHMELKSGFVGIEQSDAGIKQNDAGMKDAIAGDAPQNQPTVQEQKEHKQIADKAKAHEQEAKAEIQKNMLEQIEKDEENKKIEENLKQEIDERTKAEMEQKIAENEKEKAQMEAESKKWSEAKKEAKKLEKSIAEGNDWSKSKSQVDFWSTKYKT